MPPSLTISVPPVVTNTTMSFVPNDQKDQLLTMIKQESTTYSYNNHDQKTSLPQHHHLNNEFNNMQEDDNINDQRVQHWRHLMVSWMYTIADTFRLHHTIVATASYYLDTTISKGLLNEQEIDPVEYQIVALTSFQLAIKCHEPRVFPLTELIKLSQGNITEQNIIDMEQKILNKLAWKLHPPTYNCYLEIFINILQQRSTYNENPTSFKNWNMVKEETEKLIKIINCNGNFRSYPSSVIALTSLWIVFHKHVALSSSFERIGRLLGQVNLQAILIDIENVIIRMYSKEYLSNVMSELEPFCRIDNSNIDTQHIRPKFTITKVKYSHHHYQQQQQQQPYNKINDDEQTVTTAEDSFRDDDEEMDDHFDDEDEECCSDLFNSQKKLKRTVQISPRQVVIER